MEQSTHHASMPRSSVSWQVRPPVNEERGSIPDWIEAIRSLRGCILYAGGRRPHFKLADGRLYDADPLDLYAYHVLAYENQQLVGGVRVYPLVFHTPCSMTEKLLGSEAFEQMLSDLGVKRTTTFEASGWAVRPDYRKGGLAIQLLAGAAAIGKQLGLPMTICSAGTDDKQDRIVALIGLRAVPTVDVLTSELYNDRIRIMSVSVEKYSLSFACSVDQMAKILRLNEVSSLS